MWWNNVITVSPIDPNTVWSGMMSLYLSTDGGVTFTEHDGAGDFHVDQHAMQFAPSDPNVVVLGNDGGIFISRNGGSSWGKSYNLPITQFYAGTIAPENPNRLLGGTQDNNSLQTFTSAVDSWSYMYCCDGFYTLVDPTDPERVYAEYQNGGLAYSTDGGVSFFDGTSGIDPSDRKNWETPIALDPQHPMTLYTGTHRIYQTTNGMQSWTSISDDLTYGDGGRVGTVSTIDVSPTNADVVYVGTDDGRVWVTTDHGVTWTDIATGSLPLRWITRVTVDPDSANIAYVTLSGFLQNEYGSHLYRTTNFGASWTNIGATMPDIPLNDVVVDPMFRTHLYVATDLNVLVSTDLGASWATLGSNLPEVSVHDLAIHLTARKLVAFTHGRSAFTIEIPSAQTLTINVPIRQRWNLVSNPVSKGNDSVRVMYPTALDRAFGYSTTLGQYQPSERLPSGQGFWLKFTSIPNQVVTITGLKLDVDTIEVKTGWNLIGSVSDPIRTSSISSDPPSMTASDFYSFDGRYTSTDTIVPGHGYWVKVGQDGKLILSSVSSSTIVAQAALHKGQIQIVPISERPPVPPSDDDATPQGGEIMSVAPTVFALGRNYPNPFNPTTTIRYQLPVDSRVTLRVYNLLGEVISTLVDAVQQASYKSVHWNASDVASGIYFYRLDAVSVTDPSKTFSQIRKMVKLK